MKIAIGLGLLGLTLTAFAGESQTITYDGSQKEIELTLRGEKTRTEYSNEERPWTCYKEGIVGYETVCTPGPFPMGLPGSFPGGLNDPRYRYPIGMYPGYGRCNRMPIYRSVPYECTRNIRNAHQVKVYDVLANVKFTMMSGNSRLVNEQLKVSLNGESIEVANSSSKFLVSLSKLKESSSMSGSVKTLNSDLLITMSEASPIVSSMNNSELSIEDGVASLTTGPDASLENIVYSISVSKKKLGADKLLLEKELKDQDMILKADRNGTEAKIDLSKLGIELTKGKYAVTLKAVYKTFGKLLNANEVGSLETTKTVIYSVR